MDLIEFQKEADAAKRKGLRIGHYCDEAAAEITKAREELTAVCNFLEIALDEHDDHFGPTDPDKFPKVWDVQARKRLAQARRMANGELKE